ncbi:MAG TPA: hypothetical protein ENI13_01950, partial [candidate division CPR3 bacterium]|nr:hypothetical protein [candidate division CPR3 bacterium]
MPVTTEDLAYMAGVIDSDGYIGIVKQSETRRKHTTEYFRTVITVSQVQLEAIELLRERLVVITGEQVNLNKDLENLR